MPEDTFEKANLAIPYLVYHAQKKGTITYNELGKKIGHHHRNLGYILRYIRDDICIKKGHPMITVIVVQVDTGLPGDDFLPNGLARFLTKEKYRKKFEENRDKVYKFDKWDELLDELNLNPISE